MGLPLLAAVFPFAWAVVDLLDDDDLLAGRRLPDVVAFVDPPLLELVRFDGEEARLVDVLLFALVVAVFFGAFLLPIGRLLTQSAAHSW